MSLNFSFYYDKVRTHTHTQHGKKIFFVHYSMHEEEEEIIDIGEDEKQELIE